MLTVPARLLGEADRRAVLRLLDADPIVAAQVAERVEGVGLSWWRSGAKVFGYGGSRHTPLEALCWFGANLVPLPTGMHRSAVAAFAELAGGEGRSCSSVVGPADTVVDLWQRLEPMWGSARALRPCQPLLVADTPPVVTPDPQVRLVRSSEIDVLFPACVSMYTEEVGVSPLDDAGGRPYRERVTSLVNSRRAYARIEDGRVVFKAELAVVTRHTAQVQGVWVDPEWRDRGLGAAGMAAVVVDGLRRVAPTISLYVNDFNTAARRVYARCGFRRVGTFATVLL